MTVAQRLMILIGASVASLLLLSGTNFHLMGRVYESTNFANVNIVPSILSLDKAVMELGHLRVRVYRHALNPDPKVMADVEEKIREAKEKLEKALKDYENFLTDEEDKRLLANDRADLAEYLKAVDSILAASREGRKDEARALLTQYSTQAERINADFVAHMKYNEDLGKKTAEQGAEAKSQAIWTSAAILLVTSVLLAGLGLIIRRSLTFSIGQANRMAAQIASGDLSRDSSLATASSDEVGQLLQSLEKMRGDLARTIGEIVHGANSVVASAGELSAAASQVSVSTESQSRSTAAAAAAVEELTVSIDQVGGSADDANNRANEAGSLATVSGKQVESALEQISQVSTRVEHTAQQVQTLSEQVLEIGKITVVIRDVADQTNLLALNAAIEAARAGEQGRGFAVVADEVRKLAERTTNSVQEISAVIHSIQEGAVAAVKSMESSREVVGQVVADGGKASGAMLDVRTSTQTVQQAIGSISDALREQRATSTDLARNVESIAQMSEENSSAVASVASTANRLVDVSDSLKASVSRFRL